MRQNVRPSGECQAMALVDKSPASHLKSDSAIESIVARIDAIERELKIIRRNQNYITRRLKASKKTCSPSCPIPHTITQMSQSPLKDRAPVNREFSDLKHHPKFQFNAPKSKTASVI